MSENFGWTCISMFLANIFIVVFCSLVDSQAGLVGGLLGNAFVWFCVCVNEDQGGMRQ